MGHRFQYVKLSRVPDIDATKLPVRSWHLYALSLTSVLHCVVLWIRAKTIGEDERETPSAELCSWVFGPPCSGSWVMHCVDASTTNAATGCASDSRASRPERVRSRLAVLERPEEGIAIPVPPMPARGELGLLRFSDTHLVQGARLVVGGEANLDNAAADGKS